MDSRSMAENTQGGDMGNLAAAPIADRRTDPRIVRTRAAMRSALAEEIRSAGDLSRVTATAVATRAGLTRRTFYTHFRDVGDLVSQMEDEAIDELRGYVERIAQSKLVEMIPVLTSHEPAPGIVELLAYVRRNGDFYSALLCECGDPSFAEKIKRLAAEIVAPRALTGIDAAAVGAYFDYYLTYVVSAEVGVLVRWLAGGMEESDEVMARIMTSLLFVRPGDLYGFPLSIDVPAYSLGIAEMKKTGEGQERKNA